MSSSLHAFGMQRPILNTLIAFISHVFGNQFHGGVAVATSFALAGMDTRTLGGARQLKFRFFTNSDSCPLKIDCKALF
jgi:hypothetical protein